jgi:hypothetical protein
MTGWCGILLPWLVLGVGKLFGTDNPDKWWKSISDTYYSQAGPLFIGIMSLCCGILIGYEGYDKLDDIISSIAAIFGFLLVIFPCELKSARVWNLFMLSMEITNIIHYITAFGFLVTLAFMPAFRFTKSNGQPTTRKGVRNIVYITCSATMIFSMALGLVLSKFIDTDFPIFWTGEMLAFMAFGISWLVKSDSYPILRDVPR